LKYTNLFFIVKKETIYLLKSIMQWKFQHW
jgi:hypothetical protein